MAWLGMTLGVSGKAPQARSLVKRLHAKAMQDCVPPASFARIYLGHAEIGTAFVWLGRAVDECDQLMMPIKSYAFFHPIQADQRFRTLLRKMNLEP